MDFYNFNMVIDYNSNEEYQDTLLSLFGMEEYDNTIMNKINIIYENIKTIPDFINKMEEGAALYGSDDLEMGLVMLFSYDKLPIFHKALSRYFSKKNNTML